MPTTTSPLPSRPSLMLSCFLSAPRGSPKAGSKLARPSFCDQSASFLLMPSGLFILMTTRGLAGSCLMPCARTAEHRNKVSTTMATVARRSTFIEILSLQRDCKMRLKSGTVQAAGREFESKIPRSAANHYHDRPQATRHGGHRLGPLQRTARLQFVAVATMRFQQIPLPNAARRLE